MYLDERTCKIIDEMLRKGTTRSTELSDMLDRDHNIKLEPHFISEYKYLEITKGRFL
jgi:cytosine/adenosine deaminase-related metal-dependent hydrolase